MMRILRPSRLAVLALATPVLAAGGTVLAATGAGDRSAPRVTVTKPAPGASTFDTTPRLAGGAGHARGDSSTVTVRLYPGRRASGRPVRTLQVRRERSRWAVTISRPLAPGRYTVQARQRDRAGHRGVSPRMTFTIGTRPVPVDPPVVVHPTPTRPPVTKPPVVTVPPKALAIGSPVNGSWTGGGPSFSGTALDGAGYSSTVIVRLYAGPSTGGSAVTSWTSERSGTTWAGSAPDPLDDGQYTVQAEQENGAGGVTRSPAVTFTVDTVAPQVSLGTPPGGSSVADSTPTFSGSAGTAAGDAAHVLVYVYRGPRDTGTPVAVLDAPRTGTNFSIDAHTALAVGTYTARADQGDGAGNTGHSPARTFAVTSTAPASAYRETVMADAPRGYWRLGEGAGTTAADEIPGGTAGTYQGAPGLGSAGVVPLAQSTAATFDGVDDAIRIPDSDNLHPSSALALELWIRPAALPSSSATLMRKDLQFMLRLTSGGAVGFRLWRGGSSTEVTSPSASVKAGVWNHVVASYDGTAVTVYVNGTARSTLALGSLPDTSTNPLTLGAGTGNDHYSGRMDEPALFGTALSAARVQAHYAKASPVIDTGPTVVLESPVGGTTTDGRPEFSGVGGSESVDSTAVTVRIWSGANVGTPGSALQTLTAQRNSAGAFSITPPTTLAVGTYTARAEQTNSAGFTGFSSPATFTVSDGAAPVIAAAGDIADCSGRDDEATAALLGQIDGTVLTLGDNAYQQGSAETYQCYNASWGRYLNRTRSIPGDHDIGDSEAFTDYFDYFGTAAGPFRPAGYYSYNLGSWHVVALNSACYVQLRTCNDAEEEWLEDDLEASNASCTLALLHEPRFSSGEIHGNNDSVRPLWQILYDHGTDVVLSGSEHLYERFSPQTPAGASDPDHGIREFIVGTGGESHYQVGDIKANSQVRESNTFGVIKMTLRPGAYDWQFVPVAGKTFTDSGTGPCH